MFIRIPRKFFKNFALIPCSQLDQITDKFQPPSLMSKSKDGRVNSEPLLTLLRERNNHLLLCFMEEKIGACEWLLFRLDYTNVRRGKV